MTTDECECEFFLLEFSSRQLKKGDRHISLFHLILFFPNKDFVKNNNNDGYCFLSQLHVNVKI